MNPVNQEHLEAEQTSADITREKIKSSLGADDLARHKAVEDAVKILTDAGVKFYLFPELNNEEGVKIVWQWNSLSHFLEFDDAGRPTDKSKRINREFHDSLLGVFFHFFKNLTRESEYARQLDRLPALFHHCMSKDYERVTGNKL